jgi:hypothetical protein
MIPKWWNLVIVFSAFMIQLITFGVAGAIGLYNIEFLDYFNVPVAELSLIGSINIGVFLGAGMWFMVLNATFNNHGHSLGSNITEARGLGVLPHKPISF